MLKNTFNPLLFLATTGAGGISVGGFILLQYMVYSGKGLAILSQIPQTPLNIAIEAVMVIFAIIHFVLSAWFFLNFFSWKKTKEFREFKADPLANSALMAPILSLAMSFNVVIGTLRYFAPTISDNFQSMMIPAFGFYLLLWFWTMSKSIELLKISFTQSFDVDKIHFGWLLNPFAIAMTTVTGTGFAALAKNTETIFHNNDISVLAMFLTLISGLMAMFLTLVKLFSIFKKHLQRDSALHNHFVPTYLIIIPILTLFAISIFRIGHFAEHHWGENGEVISALTKSSVLLLFAFQAWYFAFGLSMLKGYWTGYLKNHFHVSQWGLVCPFVGFSALASFVYKIFFQNEILFYMTVTLFSFVSVLYLYLLKRQLTCIFSNGENKTCDK